MSSKTCTRREHVSWVSRAVLALGLVTIAGVLVAGQLSGDGSPLWSGALATSGTTACMKVGGNGDGGGATKCALFHAGSSSNNSKNFDTVRLSASAAGAVCCWSLKPGTAGDIDPATLTVNADDKGPCYRIPAEPAFLTTRPVWSDLTSAGGAATGLCDAATSTWEAGAAGEAVMYPPCVVATGSPGDCNTNHGLSSATCVANASASSTAIANATAYLNCEDAGSGTPVVYAQKERVLNF